MRLSISAVLSCSCSSWIVVGCICFGWLDVALYVVLDSRMLGIKGHLIPYCSHYVHTGLPPRPISL